MSSLKDYLTKKVRVITTDGRLFEGILEGFDGSTNLILSKSIEIIFCEKENSKNRKISLGIYMIRGGGVVCVGDVEEVEDFEWGKVKGSPLKDTRNPL